jgi:hypothetical protein
VAGDSGGVPYGFFEVDDGQPGRWGGDGGGVALVDAVQAQQGVEVDGAAELVFGGFAVREPDSRKAAPSGLAVEVAFHGLFGAPPQFPGLVVPYDVGVVVVAVQAERLPEQLVTRLMAVEARERDAVRTGVGGTSPPGVTR